LGAKKVPPQQHQADHASEHFAVHKLNLPFLEIRASKVHIAAEFISRYRKACLMPNHMKNDRPEGEHLQ
jgi:hypothetical protein